MREESETPKSRMELWLWIGSLSSLVVYAVIIVLGASPRVRGFVGIGEGESLGPVGDYFGGLANILALAGVVVAIILQSRELELQRKELINSRKEMESQGHTMVLQTRVLKELAKATKRQAAQVERQSRLLRQQGIWQFSSDLIHSFAPQQMNEKFIDAKLLFKNLGRGDAKIIKFRIEHPEHSAPIEDHRVFQQFLLDRTDLKFFALWQTLPLRVPAQGTWVEVFAVSVLSDNAIDEAEATKLHRELAQVLSKCTFIATWIDIADFPTETRTRFLGPGFLGSM